MSNIKKRIKSILKENVSLMTEGKRLVDNFDKIGALLEFDNPGDSFYFVQIIKRYKDNKGDDRKKGNYHAGGWYEESYRVKSLQDLMDHRQEIIDICERDNARAYISINSRSEKQTDAFAKTYAANMAKANGYDDPRVKHAKEIIAGQAKHGPSWKNTRLRFFLDVDTKNTNIWKVTMLILNYYGIETLEHYTTPSGGLHIVLPDKRIPLLKRIKQLFSVFDGGKDLGFNATVHINFDGKLILYSNVDTPGY